MAYIDKVFKAYDIRGLYGNEIDEDLAQKDHSHADRIGDQLVHHRCRWLSYGRSQVDHYILFPPANRHG